MIEIKIDGWYKWELIHIENALGVNEQKCLVTT